MKNLSLTVISKYNSHDILQVIYPARHTAYAFLDIRGSCFTHQRQPLATGNKHIPVRTVIDGSLQDNNKQIRNKRLLIIRQINKKYNGQKRDFK